MFLALDVVSEFACSVASELNAFWCLASDSFSCMVLVLLAFVADVLLLATVYDRLLVIPAVDMTSFDSDPAVTLAPIADTTPVASPTAAPAPPPEAAPSIVLLIRPTTAPAPALVFMLSTLALACASVAAISALTLLMVAAVLFDTMAFAIELLLLTSSSILVLLAVVVLVAHATCNAALAVMLDALFLLMANCVSISGFLFNIQSASASSCTENTGMLHFVLKSYHLPPIIILLS